MKLSKNFVSDYVDIPVDIKTLAEDMTGIGNEYDACGKLLPVSNLVIGKVLECSDHPDSDHLHICLVDVGDEVLQIVCGAPNVRSGLKVIVALDGAKLPGGIIRKGMIRGCESNGMLCAISELGFEHKYLKEEDISGIHELPSDAPIGEDPIKYLGLDDEVIDFELTSNRGDLLSVLGMAYEIGALYNKKVRPIELDYTENSSNINDFFNVLVETDKCPLFLAKKVCNVVIKDTPSFIKNRLIASGIRPINNVVDISNYVMLETGQPLHFYDADRLGDTFVVRMAKDNEVLVTLDGIERILSNNDIVISNKTDAISLAGVMGGITTEIEEDTKNIVIEAAIFNATSIRKTSKKVLRSEASNRFEKGLDPKRTYMAIERCCHLLEKYADATIVGGMVEVNNISMEDKTISITTDKINKVLGINLECDVIVDCLLRLGFSVNCNGNLLEVMVPSRRVDISMPEDLIEEVGRIYGIDNIVGKTMITPVKPGFVDKKYREVRDKLASLGLNETLSYALISSKDVNAFTNDEFNAVKILDPMSEERNTLRYNLLPSLFNIYKYNKARGVKNVSIFEIGKGFSKVENGYHEENKLSILMSGDYILGLENTRVDFYTVKGIVEELLDYLGYKNRYRFEVDTLSYLHPGQSAKIVLNNQKIGIIGRVHPNICKDDVYVVDIDIERVFSFRVKSMQYKDISKYPSILKDMAFVVKKDVLSSTIIDVIKKAGGKLLTDIRVFDVYEGNNVSDDEKSIAFSLTFNDFNRTLSDEEVMEIFNKIITAVESKLNAKLRDQ